MLNAFSNIYERCILNSISPFVSNFISIFISAYRKSFSSNQVLIRLIENWKQPLDNWKFVGAVLIDLSKAFEYFPHDLLIAKMHAYVFTIDSLKTFFSYWNGRKKHVKINNICTAFQVLYSGVPQGSILGLNFFNIFFNDLFIWIENAELCNFSDDDTISCTEKSLEELMKSLTSESGKAVQWFKENMMIVSPDKFQIVILTEKTNNINPTSIKINDMNINNENSSLTTGIGNR